MKTADSVRYLGDLISASGSLRPCLEDRRSRGWGKVAEMTGILAEMPDVRRIEVGLKLREAKVHNGTLFNSEAWSNVADKDIERVEQVDIVAIRAIIGGGHSKCPKSFYFLEFGTLMIRHLIVIRRLMFHYHIVTRDNSEIIKKVYLKQKESSLKGDWIQLLRKDFEFIKEDFSEDIILKSSKHVYNRYVKQKVQLSAFNEYLQMKQKCEKKLGNLQYTELSIQPYIVSNRISIEEKQLLFSLRSKCNPAKMKFRKQYKGNLKCSFQCPDEETQSHIFENCGPIKAKLSDSVNLKDIYGNINDQIKLVKTLSKIDLIRKTMKQDILPGGSLARTHVDT
jgi:hypothetical protein